MEWQKQNQYNSFNSWNGLLYAPQYAQIAKGEIPVPIEASIDPIHACNLLCKHCNSARYVGGDGDTKVEMLKEEHWWNLIDFLGEWGVKAVCYGGGGEPTLHPGLANAIILTAAKGMEVGIATNGTALSRPDLLDALSNLCRWVGVSVDAATLDTYAELKGQRFFHRVLTGIKDLVKASEGKRCEVAYKFLISSVNQGEIFEACKIAKDLGVRDFHARPADIHHQGTGEMSEELARLDVDSVLEEFHKCHQIETEQFRVFTVVHKFDENMEPVKNFKQCYGAPLAIQICADGGVYFCVDQRKRKDYLLGRHTPDPKQILGFWGGQEHKNLVFGDTPYFCKTRCTFGVYAEQCEKLFVKGNDPMCWKFT